jgi:hypothetical protein
MGGKWIKALGVALTLHGTAVLAQEYPASPVPIASSTSSRPNANRTAAGPLGVSLERPVTLGTGGAPAHQGITVRAQMGENVRSKPIGASIWGEPVAATPPKPEAVETPPLPGQVVATSGKRFIAEVPAGSTPCVPLGESNCGPWRFNGGAVDVCCSGAGPCGGTGNRWTVNVESLLWWTKGAGLPPLITMGSAADVLPGAIGQPGTSVLFGGNSFASDARPGGRLTLGYWIDDCHEVGLEGSFFSLAQRSSHFGVGSSGSPVLARPFFNTATLAPDAELIAFPGLLAGAASVDMKTRLLGAEANLKTNLCTGCNYTVDLIGGFRFIGLDDNLQIGEALSTLATPGGGFQISDSFSTRNRFYGGQVGLDTEYRYNRWFIDLKAKVALGSNHEVVKISGSTITHDPLAGTTFANGGLLALPSNIGRFSREMFAVAPEGTVNVGYQFNDNVRAYVGYNFLYLSNVVRAGNQIDPVVNPSLIPPTTASLPARPAFAFKGTDFWAQGVSFGLELRY